MESGDVFKPEELLSSASHHLKQCLNYSLLHSLVLRCCHYLCKFALDCCENNLLARTFDHQWQSEMFTKKLQYGCCFQILHPCRIFGLVTDITRKFIFTTWSA